MTLYNKGTLLFLLAATAASAWLYLLTGRDHGQAQADSRHPAIYITAPQWDMLDMNGAPEQRLRAVRMEQWSGEAGARLVEPVLEIFRQQNPPWKFKAMKGRLYTDDRPVLLQDQVIVQRSRPDGENGLVLNTERLLVERSGKYMETGAPVVLQSGNWHFKSTGLRASLGQHQVKLLNQVRGIHE